MIFYELDTGGIMCEDCVEEWKKDSASGKLVGDELYTSDQVDGVAETPAQCDSCLTQSDDYDTVLDEV
jgi:hypothetical protein